MQASQKIVYNRLRSALGGQTFLAGSGAYALAIAGCIGWEEPTLTLIGATCTTIGFTASYFTAKELDKFEKECIEKEKKNPP